MKVEKVETVTFSTTDHVTILGDYYQSEHPVGHTILALHMMPADRGSWSEFAVQANRAGYDLLAIDLRGHGESIKQDNKTLDFQTFTDQEHQDSIKDVEAAVEFLKSEKDLSLEQLSIIGASIGANLALQFIKQHPEIYTGVLISPGLNYRGIKTDQLAKELTSTQSILLIAGEQDQYPHQTVNRLKTIIPGNSQVIILPSSSHGTNLFQDHPKLIIRILSWLNQELTF